MVQGAFIQFASQGAQSSHHSFRAGYSEINSAGAFNQYTERRRPSSLFSNLFCLKVKNNVIECALSILAQQKRKTI